MFFRLVQVVVRWMLDISTRLRGSCYLYTTLSLTLLGTTSSQLDGTNPWLERQEKASWKKRAVNCCCCAVALRGPCAILLFCGLCFNFSISFGGLAITTRNFLWVWFFEKLRERSSRCWEGPRGRAVFSPTKKIKLWADRSDSGRVGRRVREKVWNTASARKGIARARGLAREETEEDPRKWWCN